MNDSIEKLEFFLKFLFKNLTKHFNKLKINFLIILNFKYICILDLINNLYKVSFLSEMSKK